MRILCISPLIVNVLGGVHLPPKTIMLLRGRCTRYFQLIINGLYIKRGKSAPPYKNFHEKNTLVIQTSQNLPLHFLELNAKHAQVDNNALKKKNFHVNSNLSSTNCLSLLSLSENFHGCISYACTLQKINAKLMGY